MPNLFSGLTIPGTVVFIVAALTAVGEGIHAGFGIEQPGHSIILSSISLLCALGWWMQHDSKLRRVKLVYDIGFFLNLVWPFLVPYYLFKTRGIRALFAIGAFVVVYAGAFVAGVMLGVFLPMN